jgi:hypothetical protein
VKKRIMAGQWFRSVKGGPFLVLAAYSWPKPPSASSFSPPGLRVDKHPVKHQTT